MRLPAAAPITLFGGRQAPGIKGAIIIVLLYLGGCATWQAPETVDDSALRTRAVSETVMDVTLSASVLSSEDSQQLFATDLNSTGVEPVWIAWFTSIEATDRSSARAGRSPRQIENRHATAAHRRFVIDIHPPPL